MDKIGGARNQIDEAAQEQIGRLLVKEEDEDLTPDESTYREAYKMTGGIFFVVGYIARLFFRRYLWHT